MGGPGDIFSQSRNSDCTEFTHCKKLLGIEGGYRIYFSHRSLRTGQKLTE